MATLAPASLASPCPLRILNADLEPRGLAIDALFCPADVPTRSTRSSGSCAPAAIKGENGEVLFEQTDCEIPAHWSQLATNVVVSKYFYGEVNTPEREHSVRQLIHRVCRTIADWGTRGRLLRHGRRRRAVLSRADLALPAPARGVQFAGLVQRRPVHQYGVRARSATGTGTRRPRRSSSRRTPTSIRKARPASSRASRDNMEDIMELARSEAMLFKFGSGTGTDLSTLRSHREKLSGGGKPSGPLSFMRVYDQIAAVVKSGGKTRRAAKMQSLKVWHPGHHGVHRVQGQGRAEGPPADRKGRLRGQLQRRSLQLDPVPERQPLGPRDRRVHAGRGRRQAVDHPLGDRPERSRARAGRPATCWPRWPNAPGAAAIRACSTTRRSTAGTPARTRAGSTPRIRARSTCSSTTRPATWRAST